MLLLATLALADLFVDASSTACAAADGSAQAPFCTIAEALTAAAPGDTVRVFPGTYRERLVIDKSVRLIGTEGDAVTIVDGEMLDTVIRTTLGATVRIEGLTVTRGRGPRGGGIDGNATLVNSTISGNTATNTYLAGGGWYARFGGVAQGCRFVDNTSYGFSGAAVSVGGNAITLQETTVTGNNGEVAVLAFAADVTLRNTTISDNVGTAVYLFEYGASGQNYSGTIEHSTITRNQGTIAFGNARAGGIQVYGGGPVRLRSSIVAENTSPLGALDVSGVQSGPTSVISNGNNMLGVPSLFTTLQDGVNGDQVGTDATPLNPDLDPIDSYGGRLETRRPRGSSSAIDRGFPMNPWPVDQRGVPRIAYRVDVGAHERRLGVADSMCTAALNSTGASARLVVTGSGATADNVAFATTLSLPRNSFAFLLTSQDTAVVPSVGGGAGTLCLGGSIGRFVGPGQIMSSGLDGKVVVPLDLTMHPTPTGLVPIVPGDTWYLQCWFRDAGAGGATSNLSDSACVTFL